MVKRLEAINALEEAEAEEAAGRSVLELDTDRPVARLIGALAWVHKRRTEPTLKFSDYMTSSKTGENLAYLLTDPDTEPDEADAGEEQEPDPATRLIDDQGVPTDPFPESAAPAGSGAATERPADAAGPVLSGDGDTA